MTPTPAAPDDAPEAARARVLIVDDEPAIRLLLVDLLEAELAAWDGDRATALRLLPRGLMVEPFLATVEDDPVYASLRDDAGFLGAIASEQARRAQLRERFQISSTNSCRSASAVTRTGIVAPSDWKGFSGTQVSVREAL